MTKNSHDIGVLIAATVATACALPSHARAAQAAVPDERPQNILLIISDDLNSWIGPMGGHPQARTPALDKLAARGVTFMNAHCPAPLCNPSRAAFMSGLRPSTTGIYLNGHYWVRYIGRGLCINDHVRDHGFKSYSAGKVYHYNKYRAADWDEVFYERDDTLPGPAGRNAKRRPGPYGYRMFTDGEPSEPFNEKRDERTLIDARGVDWCIEKLGSVNAKKRFFMACGIHRPHTPWDVPKKYFDMYPLETLELPKTLRDDLSDVPAPGVEFTKGGKTHKTILEMGIWKDRVRAYLAAISFMDAQVGRLLDALAESPHAENTVVVFVGDNGWHLGEKEHWGKTTLWAPASQVPMIWAGPGVAKGAKTDAAVDLMSLYPTLCDMAAITTPKHVDGANIKPLLKNPSAKWSRPALTTMDKGNHAITTADWRYIRYADGSEELYNRKNDPREWTNLADKRELKSVKRELAAFLPTKNAEPVKYEANKR
ncbi:sulfatase [Ereboglobus luteus]|uniref:Sulfatase N-terminal domain-containing protein n=1 Tax=Ereboglobus luteus TaxID=1796921 RepID=A0A2U8E470_9BACT|nr:sulfatase [Ereboglobus luteus]AWI09693.1 hypothetical protein CKA38_10920 [Ereboglobus luteus]